MNDDIRSAVSGRPFFCSWSGGKDSCLALYSALLGGGRVHSLLTVLSEDGVTSRSHALPKPLLEAQARALKTASVFLSATWADYERAFIAALHKYKAQGIEIGVFGDIDVDANREWVQRVCAEAGITPVHPLWQRDRRELLEEFIALGFIARVVVVNQQCLDTSFLGRIINAQTVGDMVAAGIDASGEMGEYHTVVTAGPLFSEEVPITIGPQKRHEGYGFLAVAV